MISRGERKLDGYHLHEFQCTSTLKFAFSEVSVLSSHLPKQGHVKVHLKTNGNVAILFKNRTKRAMSQYLPNCFDLLSIDIIKYTGRQLMIFRLPRPLSNLVSLWHYP